MESPEYVVRSSTGAGLASNTNSTKAIHTAILVDERISQPSPEKLLAVSGNTGSKLNNGHRVRGFRVFCHKWGIFVTPLPSRLSVLYGRGDGMIVRSRGGQ